MDSFLRLPSFDEGGLLPPKDYGLTLSELRSSKLVERPESGYPDWDAEWRLKLVENLEVMVGQLWEVGIMEIFVDGSFVEDKDRPGDIDGYFECDVIEFATGDLQRRLNELDPHKVWTWDPASRRPYRNQTKQQLPMWHRYRVELYPHFPGLTSGIRDRFGNDLPFPSAFRLSRREYKPKGIVKILKVGESS